MRLKLAYHRNSGIDVDIVLTTDSSATLGAIARELLDTDPLALERTRFGESVSLAVSPPGGGNQVPLAPDRAVGEVAIASGCVVSVIDATDMNHARGSEVAAVLTLHSGPDTGRRVPLSAGTWILGRDDSADVVIYDDFVSKRHARIDVGSVVEVVDLNSANGIVVDGGLVPRLVAIQGQELLVGDTRLTIDRVGEEVPAGIDDIQGGAIPHHRSPRIEVRFPERELARPAVPSEPRGQPFPWIMLMAPVVMGGTMFAITRNPLSLIFIAMSPMMLIGRFVSTRSRNKRQLEDSIAKFEHQLFALEGILSKSLGREQAARRAEVPTVAEVYQAALDRGCLLWTRRPEHWSFLHFGLGTASLPSRTTIAAADDRDDGLPVYARRLDDVEDKYRMVHDVPVVESSLLAGAIGVVGKGTEGSDALRAILVQVAGLHSPSEVVIAAMTSPTESEDLDWLAWLPHTSSPQSPIPGVHLADSVASTTMLLGALEDLAEQRAGQRMDDYQRGPLDAELAAVATPGRIGTETLSGPPPMPIVVLLMTENAPVDRARVVQLSERGADVGIIPIWMTASIDSLPAACRTYLDVRSGLADAKVGFVRHGQDLTSVVVEGVGREHALRFALALAPLVDSGAVLADASDLPRQVSMVSLLGDELTESSASVVDRWRQNFSLHDRTGSQKSAPRSGTLRALVGQAGIDAMHLDLRTDGPHALVGGTTGSGKSEFLQAWVLGMAAEYSPDRVTFLFIDYKGGAAFADCVRLPHSVGLVTDLSPHLVRRALMSLRAELRHREHLLNRKKAKDLLELERRGDPESPPALILVIDEFAALVGEVPEFVDGVVDIAQRGRSLGIHLIMATQRPAGVIKDNLRANTNLRIALRMADESDSTDVIGSPVAAGFASSIPGRAIAKNGPGRLVPFQSAYAGGHTSSEPDPPSVDIHALRFGSVDRWESAEPEQVVEATGATDQVRLVDSIAAASRLAELPSPRRPWLDELSGLYDLSLLAPRTDSELILGVADVPARQAQDAVYFRPDVDGNLLVYGTGGSGKTVMLRTLATGAGVTPRGGPVHVYGLDFAAGGLRMLEDLPHVGAVVSGDDSERVVRLLRTLRDLVEDRSRTFTAVNAGSIAEYRSLTGKPDEPRILVLVDNFPAFRDAYEAGGGRSQWYGVFLQLLTEGRQLGVHIVLTADRPAAVPGAVTASVPRRVVLRVADESMYLVLDVESDVLGPGSPPGRAIVDGSETQIAILGDSSSVADQSQAIGMLAETMRRKSIAEARPIDSLPTEVALESLPSRVGDKPLLGVSDVDLEPIGFDPTGTFLLGGGPASGRSNALAALALSVRRWEPSTEMIYLGHRRSSIPSLLEWDEAVTDQVEIASIAKELTNRVSADTSDRIAIVVESLSDLASAPTDTAIVELIRAIRRSSNLLIAESETSTWGSSYPIFGEIKAGRRGLLLQPEAIEGDTIMRTSFPRAARSEFPPGRGLYVQGGKVTRVQLPLV